MSIPDYSSLVVVLRNAVQRFDEASSLQRFEEALAWGHLIVQCSGRIELVANINLHLHREAAQHARAPR